MAKKRKKKREKREPKPPTWIAFKCFNQTREEVHFGISMNTPKWHGSRYDLQGVPELAHWDVHEDKIMITKLFKRKPFPSKEAAWQITRSWERSYTHRRNFWVIQTGPNTLLTPRERKPIKPIPVPRYYFSEADLQEDADMDADDELDDETTGEEMKASIM
jgi:hypothetical protein